MHDIIIAIIGSGLLTALATSLINSVANKHKLIKELKEEMDKTNERMDKIEERQVTSEKDALRTQLLVLISDYPDNVEGIMEVARHYFVVLKGNWYMTALFNQWLEKTGMAKGVLMGLSFVILMVVLLIILLYM